MAAPISQYRALPIPANLPDEERLELLIKAREARDMRREAEAQAAKEQGFVYQRRSGSYFDDPVAWAHDCIAWPEGRALTVYQEEILTALVEHRKVSVRGPRGLGKTALMSIALLHFALTRDAAGADWKCITTASTGNQLEKYLWPEVHKWARLLRWDVIGRDPFDPRRELLQFNLKLRYGAASKVNPEEPEQMEGAHADQLFYVYDEAKLITDAMFDATVGAFSTAGKDDGTSAYAMAMSTPGDPVGRFYDIHARRPGLESWWVRWVKLEEAITAGRVTDEWEGEVAALWGKSSALFRNHALGEFASSSTDGVIPLGWIEAAFDRWRAMFVVDGVMQGKHREVADGTRAIVGPNDKLHTIGVDVALGGEDRTVFALRQGNTILELRRYPFDDDTTVISGKVVGVQRAHGEPKAIVDAIGVGAGVFNEIRAEGTPVAGFVGSQGTHRHDISGEFGFTRKRSWAYWNLREMLDPTNGCDIALPPDDRLLGDLVAPKWKEMAGARIQVETKEEIKKRIGRSPDDGDAVVYAFTESGGSWADLYRSDDELAEQLEAEVDVPQPTQKPARSGGWADVYRPRDKDDDGQPAKPKPSGSNAAPAGQEQQVDPRAGLKPCACGNLRRDHPDDGPCIEEGCGCQAFSPRS
ncbi:MAG: hypothetical protein V4472_24940 [Pseudomonadota bacterium]